MTDRPRCVLAYSGGLDTSVAIRWLIDELGYDVITLTADLGEAKQVSTVTDRALATGALRAHAADARELFIEQFAFPSLMAGALYEGVYPLATALARPLIARLLVDVAREEGATAIAHGCTGKGNDQVRFDVAVGALAPELQVVAPVRDWGMGRPDELRYAAEHGIDTGIASSSPYSIDANLWGRAIECGALEDPWSEPPAEVFSWTTDPGTAPAGGVEVTVGFRGGVPVSLDGDPQSPAELVARLNVTAGRNGVGRVDHVENRLVGIKSREVYESPAATVLFAAHQALEALTLSRDVLHVKRRLGDEWARLVYDGLWYGSLRTALWEFVRATQAPVTGEVRVRCERGGLRVLGRRAPASLYRPELATYDRASDSFDHSSARGFIELFGLPLRTQTRVQSDLQDLEPLAVRRTVKSRDTAV